MSLLPPHSLSSSPPVWEREYYRLWINNAHATVQGSPLVWTFFYRICFSKRYFLSCFSTNCCPTFLFKEGQLWCKVAWIWTIRDWLLLSFPFFLSSFYLLPSSLFFFSLGKMPLSHSDSWESVERCWNAADLSLQPKKLGFLLEYGECSSRVFRLFPPPTSWQSAAISGSGTMVAGTGKPVPFLLYSPSFLPWDDPYQS